LKSAELTGIVTLFALFAGTVIALVFLLRPRENQTQYMDLRPTRVESNIPTIVNDAIEVIPVEKANKSFNKRENVTSTITKLYEQKDGFPWSSFTLYNNGPDPVYCCVNEWNGSEAPILVGQSVDIDFRKKHSIHEIFLKCDEGQTASVNMNIIE